MESQSRLEVFKALGDNTRYAIYLELARSASPLATGDIADSLGLHANTVRSHLERMRELGLLQVHVESSGGVGRPQHRYGLAADAPSLGLEPPVYPMLARMLLTMAGESKIGAAEAVDAGNDQGAYDARRSAATAGACVDALSGYLQVLGFDPEGASEDQATTIAFTHCPFAELAAVNPELVCGLHQGIVEGFVTETGGCAVKAFRTLVDPEPCRVELAVTV